MTTGKGKMNGKGFEHHKALADKLTVVNGMAPWVCVFQDSPRRWSYGIRFFPVTGAFQQVVEGIEVTPVARGAVA